MMSSCKNSLRTRRLRIPTSTLTPVRKRNKRGLPRMIIATSSRSALQEKPVAQYPSPATLTSTLLKIHSSPNAHTRSSRRNKPSLQAASSCSEPYHPLSVLRFRFRLVILVLRMDLMWMDGSAGVGGSVEWGREVGTCGRRSVGCNNLNTLLLSSWMWWW